MASDESCPCRSSPVGASAETYVWCCTSETYVSVVLHIHTHGAVVVVHTDTLSTIVRPKP